MVLALRLAFIILLFLHQLGLFLPRRTRPKGFYLILPLSLGLGALHLWLEGWLWYFLPAYALASAQGIHLVLVWFNRRETPLRTKRMNQVAAVFRILSTIPLTLGVLVPLLAALVLPPEGPRPTGPYTASGEIFQGTDGPVLVSYPRTPVWSVLPAPLEALAQPERKALWDQHLQASAWFAPAGPGPTLRASVVVFQTGENRIPGDYGYLLRELSSWGLVCVVPLNGAGDLGHLAEDGRRVMTLQGLGYNGRWGVVDLRKVPDVLRLTIRLPQTEDGDRLVLGPNPRDPKSWRVSAPGFQGEDWTESPGLRPWMRFTGEVSPQASALWGEKTALIRDFLIWKLRDGPSLEASSRRHLALTPP